jgi:anti-sigma regulatory factor (Ser/Thr protein kinase)
MTGEWPRQDFLELGPLPGAVPCARLHTRLVLTEWDLAGLIESAEIVVSELITNAVAATRRLGWMPPPPVRMWLLADATRVLIAVWDANPRLPARSEVDELTESGRGLLLVESLATHWDAYLTSHYGGKVVRARCAISHPAVG